MLTGATTALPRAPGMRISPVRCALKSSAIVTRHVPLASRSRVPGAANRLRSCPRVQHNRQLCHGSVCASASPAVTADLTSASRSQNSEKDTAQPMYALLCSAVVLMMLRKIVDGKGILLVCNWLLCRVAPWPILLFTAVIATARCKQVNCIVPSILFALTLISILLAPLPGGLPSLIPAQHLVTLTVRYPYFEGNIRLAKICATWIQHQQGLCASLNAVLAWGPWVLMSLAVFLQCARWIESILNSKDYQQYRRDGILQSGYNRFMEAGIATDITTDAHTTVTDVPGAQATSSTGTANCFSDRAGQKAVSLTSKEAPSTVAADVTAAADSTVLASGSIVNSEASRSGLPAQVLNQASLGERNAIAESRFDSHTAAASRTRPSWDTAQSYDPRSSVYTSSDKSPAVSAVQEASDTAPQDRAGQGQADGLGDDDLSGGCFGSWHQTSQKVFSQASDAASLEFPGKASDIALPVVVHATRNQNSGGASSLPSDVKSGIDGDSLPSTGLDSGTAQKELLLELFDMVLANEVVRDRDVAMDKVQQLERELQAAMAAASAAAAAADNSGDSIRERDAALDKVQELERELQAMEAAAANNEGELTQARDAALAEVQQLEKELQAVREAAADSRTQVRQLKAEVRALNAVSADRYKQHRAAANATANQVWQLEAELQAVKAAAADSQGKMYAADDATLGQVQQVEKDLQNVRAAASEAGAKATTEPTALASPVVQLQTRPGVDEPKEGARAQPEAEAILPASPPRQVYVKTRKGQATEAKLEHASSQQPKLHTLDDTFASPAEAEKEASPTLDRSAANNPHGHAPNAESAVEVKVDFADASAQSAVEVKVDLADNVGDCDNWVCLQRGKASYKAGKGPNQLAASHHEAGDGKVHVYVHQDLLQ